MAKISRSFVRLSRKGQIVIPQSIRQSLSLREGMPLAITTIDKMIVLRKVEVPDIEKEWDAIFAWGRRYAREKGIKPKDVAAAIREARKERR